MPVHSAPLLRPATLADIPALIALQTQIWEPTYRSILRPDQITYMFEQIYSPPSLAEQMTTQGHTFLLASTEKFGLQGFASFGPTAQSEIYKLHKIYVSLQAQGSGLGRTLLTEVEIRARALGGHWLRLNVHRANPARYFYERQGFSVLREEDIPFGPYVLTDFVMQKPL